jgi:trans-aconitate methyltransferase
MGAGSLGVTADAGRWNANLDAIARLLRHVPPGARRGLDVGCGEGETTRMLRGRVPSVVGVDPDRASITEARSHGDDIEYIASSLSDVDLPARSFDVVTAVAMLHHVEHRDGLRRLADLVAPGGVLLIVGLARSASVRDFARDVRDAVAIRRHTFTKTVWETPAPKIWPPPLSYAEVRAASVDVLPDACVARMSYFRYGLTWVRAPSSA